MPDRASRASRAARAMITLAASGLLVLSPLRIVWTSETTGIFGPLLIWLLLVVLVRTALRSPGT